MRKKRILIICAKNNYRREKRTKDWVRSWLFSADVRDPYLQFRRLNPEE